MLPMRQIVGGAELAGKASTFPNRPGSLRLSRPVRIHSVRPRLETEVAGAAAAQLIHVADALGGHVSTNEPAGTVGFQFHRAGVSEHHGLPDRRRKQSTGQAALDRSAKTSIAGRVARERRRSNHQYDYQSEECLLHDAPLNSSPCVSARFARDLMPIAVAIASNAGLPDADN